MASEIYGSLPKTYAAAIAKSERLTEQGRLEAAVQMWRDFWRKLKEGKDGEVE